MTLWPKCWNYFKLPSSRFLDANGQGELGDHFDIFEYRTTLILTLCEASKEAAFLGDSVFVYVLVSRKPKRSFR